MDGTLEYSIFKPLSDALFEIRFTDEICLSALLVEVKELTTKSPSGKMSFSMVFQTEQTDQYFTQSTYNVSHKEAGKWDLFLVPIGPGADSGKMRYEAIIT